MGTVADRRVRVGTDGLLGAAFLMLTMVVPYQTSPKRQQAQIWLWSIVVFIMFSVLLSLFRVKNRGRFLDSSLIACWLIAFDRIPVQATPLIATYTI